MPLEFDDPDDDGERRPTQSRLGNSKGPWWRPASKAGRIFLATCTVLVLGGFTTVSLMLKHYVEHDPRFRIASTENIQAVGLTEVSRAQMLPVFGEDVGRNVFFVPLNERRKQLEEIPWIERATVMRVLPNQIRVAVVERTPVAFTRHGQEIGLVDASGVLLAMSPATMAKRHYSFPVVTGIDPGDSGAGRRARVAVYMRLVAELDAGGKHNSEQISEIDLTDPEDARVLMPEQGTDILAHLGEDHFLERYERYKAHIVEWRQQYPHLAGVDLRYADQVVLDMTSGKEAAEPSPVSGAAADASVPAAGGGTPAGAKVKPGAKGSNKRAAKRAKPSPEKKHSAVPKRRATQSAATGNLISRNSNAKVRPAATVSGSKQHVAASGSLAAAQDG